MGRILAAAVRPSEPRGRGAETERMSNRIKVLAIAAIAVVTAGIVWTAS